MAQPEDMNQLFAQRGRHINYAKSIVLNQTDAEDIVQDCYEKILVKMEQFSDKVQNHNAYFMRMLRNGCLDFIRKRKIEEEVDDHVQLNMQTPELILEQKQALSRLEKCLQKIPEKQRTVFYLREIEGFELAEIASVLDMQNEAVRANLSRARKKVRELYKTHSYE